MLYKGPIVPKRQALLIFFVLLSIAWMPLSLAQTTMGSASGVGAGGPPPDISSLGKLPARDPNAITVDGWLLYPTLRVYSDYQDNFLQTPTNPLSVGGLGVTPSVTAVHSDGIHTTTLYGNLDRQDYPTNTSIDALNGRAGFTQRYEAMRDLIFTVNGDYNHQTLATGLQSSIQLPAAAPATTILPNGNTLLPNGTILSPSGQPVGQANAAVSGIVPVEINPSNQFTGTFTIDKIFNRAALSLSGSISRTEFENQTVQPNFTSKTFTENAAAWLGPLVYAYSNGSVSAILNDTIAGINTSALFPSTTSYRVVGGLGTRPGEWFRGSVYFGHQGSEGGGETAGGNVYGGQLSYRPTPELTFTGTVDRTINIASQPFATNLALTVPSLTAVQIPLFVSTITTSYGLQAGYSITQQWFANCQLFYSQIEYVGTARLDNSWVVDTSLRYDMTRSLSILWEYRYSPILSNVPLASINSNYAIMAATYRF
jgi:hypothetical protein